MSRYAECRWPEAGFPRVYGSTRSADGLDFLSIKIDDPSLAGPIYASLFAYDDGDTFTLVWNRGRKPTAA